MNFKAYDLNTQVFLKDDKTSYFKKTESNKVLEIFVNNNTIYDFEIIWESKEFLWLYDPIRNVNVKITTNSLFCTWKAFWRKKTDMPFEFEWKKICEGYWTSDEDFLLKKKLNIDLNKQIFLKDDLSSFFIKNEGKEMKEIFLINSTIFVFEIIEENPEGILIYDKTRNGDVKITSNSLFWAQHCWENKIDRKWSIICNGKWLSEDESKQFLMNSTNKKE